jgi:hypothetical protein
MSQKIKEMIHTLWHPTIDSRSTGTENAGDTVYTLALNPYGTSGLLSMPLIYRA